jgi:hypothetical protein
VLVVHAGSLQHEPRDPLRGLAWMVDFPDCVGGKVQLPYLSDRIQRRPPDERVGGQEQRPVDVEQDELCR